MRQRRTTCCGVPKAETHSRSCCSSLSLRVKDDTGVGIRKHSVPSLYVSSYLLDTTLAGDNVAAGNILAPLSGSVCGLLGALSLIITAAFLVLDFRIRI